MDVVGRALSEDLGLSQILPLRGQRGQLCCNTRQYQATPASQRPPPTVASFSHTRRVRGGPVLTVLRVHFTLGLGIQADVCISLAKASPHRSLASIGQKSVTYPYGGTANILNGITPSTTATICCRCGGFAQVLFPVYVLVSKNGY